jgi:hypothetical protein
MPLLYRYSRRRRLLFYRAWLLTGHMVEPRAYSFIPIASMYEFRGLYIIVCKLEGNTNECRPESVGSFHSRDSK